MTLSLIWSPLDISLGVLNRDTLLSTLVSAAKTLVQYGGLGAQATPEAYAQAIG